MVGASRTNPVDPRARGVQPVGVEGTCGMSSSKTLGSKEYLEALGKLPQATRATDELLRITAHLRRRLVCEDGTDALHYLQHWSNLAARPGTRRLRFSSTASHAPATPGARAVLRDTVTPPLSQFAVGCFLTEQRQMVRNTPQGPLPTICAGLSWQVCWGNAGTIPAEIQLW